MLDRVTKAIETEFFKVEEFGTGRGIVTPERIAKAAMTAMREPTLPMVMAAGYLAHDEAWRAMIDEALK